MEVVDYRITEGSAYCWNCYGPDAYTLDSWNGEQNGHSFSIVFDTKTQEVYEVQAHDYVNDRAYRMFNPDFKSDHDEEACNRGIDAREAWDEVTYNDLEVEDDFIQKALAIKAGEDYDTRISVPLELDNDVMFELMVQAHEQDITLNEHIENILRVQLPKMLKEVEEIGIDEFKSKNKDFFEDTKKKKKHKK